MQFKLGRMSLGPDLKSVDISSFFLSNILLWGSVLKGESCLISPGSVNIEADFCLTSVSILGPFHLPGKLRIGDRSY